MQIDVQQVPELASKPNFHFVKSDFDAAIWNKGYDVYHDKMMDCPCSVQGRPNPICRNCFGSGWVITGRTQTKMLLTSMNQETTFKEWSQQKEGIVRITSMDVDNLSIMDRIILYKNSTLDTSVLQVKFFKNIIYATTIYEISKIIDIFRFKGPDNLLERLVLNTDYTFEKNRITFDRTIFADTIIAGNFDNIVGTSLQVSIKYEHCPQFHIIDLGREIMYADIDEKLEGTLQNVKFPFNAVGRKSHFVVDSQNYDDTYVLDNTIVTLPSQSCQ